VGAAHLRERLFSEVALRRKLKALNTRFIATNGSTLDLFYLSKWRYPNETYWLDWGNELGIFN